MAANLRIPFILPWLADWCPGKNRRVNIKHKMKRIAMRTNNAKAKTEFCVNSKVKNFGIITSRKINGIRNDNTNFIIGVILEFNKYSCHRQDKKYYDYYQTNLRIFPENMLD